MTLESLVIKNDFCMALSMMGFLVLIPIAISLIREQKIKRPETKMLIYLTVFQMVVCLADFYTHLLQGRPEYNSTLILYDIVATSSCQMTLFCFIRYEMFNLRKRVFIADWVTYVVAFICGTTIIISIVGIMQPSPWFNGYDSMGYGYYTGLFWIPYMFPLILMFFCVALTWSCRDRVPYSDILTFLSCMIFPFFGGIVDVVLCTTTVYPMSSLGVLMLYTNIHIDSIRQEVTNEKELTQSKAKLMVSQIQPHFMYNSLNAIYYLIGADPERAQEALSTFSDYLRQNVNSLKSDAPVSFANEMSHTRAYLSLEKLRFEDMLQIELDIQTDDFVVPALSVQPLVENAVKHGVTQKEEGGKVTIKSEEKGGDYIITISDDGVGFAPGEFKDDHAHSHVGIENVRSRLETMIDAKLYVDSTPGEGTVCTIIIPKDGQPDR